MPYTARGFDVGRGPANADAVAAGVAMALVLASAGCGGLRHVPRDPASVARTFDLRAALRGGEVSLHLMAPPRPRDPWLIVLYASGDGGWFGAAVDMFHTIGDAGFYAVGVSSRSLLHREHAAGRTPAIADLARDYDTVLDQATDALGLPRDRRVVLSGWSRGASLAVLIGGSNEPPRNLAGVIAIGLAADEDLDVREDSDDDPPALAEGRQPGELDMYGRIADLAPHRCAVIQSTGDGYLPASRARELFGPDTDIRRFFEVQAANHRFGNDGGRFGARLSEALRWIAGDEPRSAEE